MYTRIGRSTRCSYSDVNFSGSPAGEFAVISVLETTTTLVAVVLPKLTVDPISKFVPVIVTEVPPTTGPLLGVTPVTVGTGA